MHGAFVVWGFYRLGLLSAEAFVVRGFVSSVTLSSVAFVGGAFVAEAIGRRPVLYSRHLSYFTKVL